MLVKVGLQIAALVGALIVGLILIGRTGAVIGIRITKNMFTDQIANVSVYSLLMAALILIELLILAFLFVSSRGKSAMP